MVISCAAPHGNVTWPYALTVLTDPCDASTSNLLAVTRPVVPGHRVNYTVCVTPLNFRYNNYQPVSYTHLTLPTNREV